jgi:hypothetical protein
MSLDSFILDSSLEDSRLLSESASLPSTSGVSSHTGPGGNDLSISELSLSGRPDWPVEAGSNFSMAEAVWNPDNNV